MPQYSQYFTLTYSKLYLNNLVSIRYGKEIALNFSQDDFSPVTFYHLLNISSNNLGRKRKRNPTLLYTISQMCQGKYLDFSNLSYRTLLFQHIILMIYVCSHALTCICISFGLKLGIYACHTSGLPLSNVCCPVLIFIYSFLIASTVVLLSISIPKFSVISKKTLQNCRQLKRLCIFISYQQWRT